jgi:hypothetical protein
MSFMQSASEVHLVDGHILTAVLTMSDGNRSESNLDLDMFIGNDDGWFMWDGDSKFLPKIPLSILQQQQLQPIEDD